MFDDPEPPDVDARLRAALAPGDAAARRVIEGALAGAAAPPRRPRVAVAVTAFALVACVAALVFSVREAGRAAAVARPPASLSITGRGPVVSVEANDGRRWIVGASSDTAPRGGYVIVIQRLGGK
jgi:hypothetical protein